jgi:GldM N-terminal domain
MYKYLFAVMKKIAFALCCLFVISTSCGGKKAPDMMDKLIYIYEILDYNVRMNNQESKNALYTLRKKLKSKLGYIPEADSLIQKAVDLRHKTASLIQFVEECKKEIFKKIGQGTDSINGMPQKPHEIRGLYELMTNSVQKYNAEKLKMALDEYVTYLNQNFKVFLSTPFFSLSATPQKMDFATYYFSNTSVIVALAMLTRLQSDALRYESECIKKLMPYHSGHGFVTIAPLVEAESNKVEEGDDYVARIYLVERIPSGYMRIFANGVPVSLNSRREGEVRWKATGKGKQRWKGEINIKLYGRDTTFVVYPEYEVIPKVK